jgi:hypothetical protein
VREAGDPPLQFRGAQAKVPISGVRLTQNTTWSMDWKRSNSIHCNVTVMK